MDNKKIKRRYNLTYKARKDGFSISTPKRTISVPDGTDEDKLKNKHIVKLRKEFGYVVQTFIPMPF